MTRNGSQASGQSDANAGAVSELQTVIASAVETAMRMAASELAATLDDRISRWLWEYDQLSTTAAVASQLALSGVSQGPTNPTTSGTLNANAGNVRLPVGGSVPSVLSLPVFTSSGGQ